MGTAEENFTGGSGYGSVGCDPEGSHPRGGLLSQLCYQTRGMDTLTFIKIHKLLPRKPRYPPPLNKPLVDESMYYRKRR